MLIDAGPLIALINADEEKHEPCRSVARSAQPPLLTTWPVFTEAMYLLGRETGWPGQNALWSLLSDNWLRIANPTSDLNARAQALMKRYSDLPMDLADATLVALAEKRNEREVFTLDSDFYVYKLHGRKVFKVVP